MSIELKKFLRVTMHDGAIHDHEVADFGIIPDTIIVDLTRMKTAGNPDVPYNVGFSLGGAGELAFDMRKVYAVEFIQRVIVPKVS